MKFFNGVLNSIFCNIKLRSYNGRLTNVYIHSTMLMKSHFKCVEKKITVDWLRINIINTRRSLNESEQKLIVDLV